MGKAYARGIEIPALKRWEKLGGTIDYITTDNVYGLYCKAKHEKKKTVLAKADMPMFIAEMVNSLKEMQAAFPDAQLGIIESPAYFCFRFDNDKKALPVHNYLSQVYFKDYMETFLEECKRKKVVITHFHFDYHIQGFIKDSNLLHDRKLSLQQMPAAADLSLERVRQITAFFRKRGIATGICITPGAYGNKAFSDSPDRDAARSLRTVFSAFAESDIKMDHLLFQHWHEHPTLNGPERQKETFMYNTLQIMKSEDFRKLTGE